MSLKEIRRDKRVKKFNDLVRSGAMSLDCEKAMNDIDQLHSGRKIRDMLFKQMFGTQGAHKLGEAEHQNQVYRSRLVEIKLSAMRRRLLLERQLQNLRKYIQIEYSLVLRKQGGTVAERTSALEYVLEPGYTLISELSAVEDYANIVIDDVDKTHWTIQSLLQALNMEARGA